MAHIFMISIIQIDVFGVLELIKGLTAFNIIDQIESRVYFVSVFSSTWLYMKYTYRKYKSFAYN